MTLLLFAGLGMQEIIFLLLIVLLLFGGKKIPEMMKGLGQGVRSFKDGMNATGEDAKPAQPAQPTQTTTTEKPEEKKDEQQQ